MAIPQLKIVEANSAAINDGLEGAKPGTLQNSITNEFFDHLLVIPLYYESSTPYGKTASWAAALKAPSITCKKPMSISKPSGAGPLPIKRWRQPSTPCWYWTTKVMHCTRPSCTSPAPDSRPVASGTAPCKPSTRKTPPGLPVSGNCSPRSAATPKAHGSCQGSTSWA